MNLSNSGDEVLFLDIGDTVVDALSWGDSTWAFDPAAPSVAKGHTLEWQPAYIDTAADWKDQPIPMPGDVDLSVATPTPFPSLTLTPFGGGLLLSEVYYRPTRDKEWVEIYNMTSFNLNISTFKIGDHETAGGQREGMYQFPPGATIAPGQAVVVANNANAFNVLYRFNPDYELSDTDPTIPDMIKY